MVLRTSPTEACLRARPSSSALVQSTVSTAAPVDDDHRVRHKESGAIQDVRVVIRLTEEQYGTVVTHVAERTSRGVTLSP